MYRVFRDIVAMLSLEILDNPRAGFSDLDIPSYGMIAIT